MIRSLWLKFFLVLVAVSSIALSSAFLLRGLMVSDFRGYLEGEMEDRVYWVTAALESTYENYSAWERARIIENTIWALMLGMEIKLYDNNGEVVMDSETAITALSPLVKKRVTAVSEIRLQEQSGSFIPYVLFLRGHEIGTLEVRFLRPQKEMVFIRRSNRLLLFSVLAVGGSAVLLSVIFSMRLTRPVKGLTEAVMDIGEGNLTRRVDATGGDEIGKLSRAFNRMAQALETNESLRKKLTSSMAHELRTPISAIRGELEGMIDGFIPMDREHLQSLHAEIGRLKKIVEGVEDVTQAEASSLTLRKESFELRPFLKNILDRFKKVSHDRGVSITLHCDPALNIYADPDKLSQIIINLLSNSLKAADKDGNIWIKATGSGTDVKISVIDDGFGIKEKDLPFIFERFYKASEGGLGLGLTIVKELVDAHGGTISVQSAYGKGSTFTASFPLSSHDAA